MMFFLCLGMAIGQHSAAKMILASNNNNNPDRIKVFSLSCMLSKSSFQQLSEADSSRLVSCSSFAASISWTVYATE